MNRNQSFFLRVTGLGKMASIMRLRRRFIFNMGVSFSSDLFSILAFVSAGLASGERKLISTGGGGSGAALVLSNRSNIHQYVDDTQIKSNMTILNWTTWSPSCSLFSGFDSLRFHCNIYRAIVLKWKKQTSNPAHHINCRHVV